MNRDRAAARHRDIGERFLVFHDDMYLIAPTTIDDLAHPYGWKVDQTGIAKWRSSERGWLRMKGETLAAVENGRGFAYDFSNHMPVLYETGPLLEVAERFGLGEKALSPATLYHNLQGVEPNPKAIGEVQIRVGDKGIDPAVLSKRWPDRKVLNHVASRFGDVKWALEQTAPSPSRWERAIAKAPRPQAVALAPAPA